MTKASKSPFQTVAILGAGTMGAGIAQVTAMKGVQVIMYDLKDAYLKKGTEQIRAFLDKGREKGKITETEAQAVETHLSTTTTLSDLAGADLVIEAVPEDLDLKKKIFGELDETVQRNAILASNTSSLSITALAAVTGRPERVAGLHFFNPVPLMKLVEVVRGQRTGDDTVRDLADFSAFLGKTPAITKDTPGFIVNRVARPFYGEALKLLGEHGQLEDMAATIDQVMREAGGFRMGPFELMDLIGIDVNFAVTQSVYEATFHEARYRPSPIQQKMVEAGLLGRKTGRGFYQYDR